MVDEFGEFKIEIERNGARGQRQRHDGAHSP
jgi:hypothetical protein